MSIKWGGNVWIHKEIVDSTNLGALPDIGLLGISSHWHQDGSDIYIMIPGGENPAERGIYKVSLSKCNNDNAISITCEKVSKQTRVFKRSSIVVDGTEGYVFGGGKDTKIFRMNQKSKKHVRQIPQNELELPDLMYNSSSVILHVTYN